jgi:hypothetical protein
LANFGCAVENFSTRSITRLDSVLGAECCAFGTVAEFTGVLDFVIAHLPFRDTVIVERETTKKARRLFYTTDWQPIADRMHIFLPPSEPRDPPRCLDEMLRLATRLGTALGTYMRVDFFATPRGCVFNEFSSTPADGDNFTAYCDDIFGGYWEEKFPHAT